MIGNRASVSKRTVINRLMKTVIADAGPIIALSRIDKLELLKQIFQQVVITETVRDEILGNKHSRGKTDQVVR